MTDGQTYSDEIIAPKGEVENPMTRSDVEAKFLGLAVPVIGQRKSRAVINDVQALDSRDSLQPLLATLRGE